MNVVQRVNGVQPETTVPVYDLAGDEVVFPLAVIQDGQAFEAMFLMNAQVPAHEVKAVLSDLSVSYKATDAPNEREIDGGDEISCQKFVTKHFRSILGAEGAPTHEDMVAWLDANPAMKARIFREGYDGLSIDDSAAQAPRLRLVVAPTTTVRVKQRLYDPKSDRLESVRMAHVCRKETEEDRIRYRRATRLAEKGRVQTVHFNYDTIEQMYDGLVMRLEGVITNGQPCNESNRSEWIKAIPYTHKLFVVSNIFSRLAVKNG